jgi:hypothetical protein
MGARWPTDTTVVSEPRSRRHGRTAFFFLLVPRPASVQATIDGHKIGSENIKYDADENYDKNGLKSGHHRYFLFKA